MGGVRPVQPALHAEAGLEGHVEGVVVQPLVLAAKGLHRRPVPGIAGLEGLAQQSEAGGVDPAVVHIAALAAPVLRLQLRGGEEAVLRQEIQVNEVGVAGKGGEALVGAVAIAGGAQGQQLPVLLAGGPEEIGKGVGLPSQGADAVGGGEGGDMHEDTAVAVHSPSLFLFGFWRGSAPSYHLRPPL